jgi:hypothetical protein
MGPRTGLKDVEKGKPFGILKERDKEESGEGGGGVRH